MSATVIDGGPAGPDEAGGQYRNRILTDRAAWWQAVGGRQGVLEGFDWSVVAGQLVLEFAPGKAAVEERDTLGVANTGRGYLVWQDADNLATFGAPSASSRNDAVVLAFVDVAVGTGALGTQTSVVGGQIVVVPGVSGTTTPRTDADIQAAVGSGGWVRLLDVQIDPSDTEINPANVIENTDAFRYKWKELTLASGWAVRSGSYAPAYLLHGSGKVELRGAADKASGTTSGDSPFATLPTEIRPASRVNLSVTHSRVPATTAPNGRLDIETTGANTVWTDGDNTGSWFTMDGCSYYVV